MEMDSCANIAKIYDPLISRHEGTDEKSSKTQAKLSKLPAKLLQP